MHRQRTVYSDSSNSFVFWPLVRTLSSRTFYMRPNKCTSTPPLHEGEEASGGIFLFLIKIKV